MDAYRIVVWVEKYDVEADEWKKELPAGAVSLPILRRDYALQVQEKAVEFANDQAEWGMSKLTLAIFQQVAWQVVEPKDNPARLHLRGEVDAWVWSQISGGDDEWLAWGVEKLAEAFLAQRKQGSS